MVAILRNTSKVRVIIGRAVNFAVPAGSTSVKDLTRCGLRWGCVELRQRSISKESYFWHKPGNKEKDDFNFQGEELVVEPGQFRQIAFDHEFCHNVSPMIIYAHFNLPRYLCKSEHKIGWSGISFYNITSGTGVSTTDPLDSSSTAEPLHNADSNLDQEGRQAHRHTDNHP